jgi:S-adenosylmethionine uptake transporter
MQALWMLLASFFFAAMGACVKIASAWFNAAELVCYRGILGMLMFWMFARWQKIPLRTPHLAMHGWRSLVGVLSLWAWFYSLAGLPLATAMTLNYMSSIWIAAFLIGGAMLNAGPMRSDSPPSRQGPLVATVAAGFAGVLLMLRPTIEQNQVFAGLVGLLSGLTAAFAYMQVMSLARLGEPATRTVFYFAVGSAIAGAAGMAVTGTASPWNWQHALWLLPIAVLASLGQLFMTLAYSHGATLVVANLQYSGIVFGAFFGVLLFGDRIPLAGWAGMALIMASGIAATALRARAAPDSPAEEH